MGRVSIYTIPYVFFHYAFALSKGLIFHYAFPVEGPFFEFGKREDKLIMVLRQSAFSFSALSYGQKT